MRHFARKIHLVGIGGAGMNGLAELLHRYGHVVTGSDRSASDATARLEQAGIQVQIGHEPDLVKKADLLVYSSAVKPENPERAYAREHGITEMRRAEVLGEIMRTFTTVCIAGTHGKTTTTSMVGSICTEAGLKPTILVGGTMVRENTPLVMGEGPIMVAEADEYDRSFLVMNPAVALITNIDADHLDCYADIDDIKGAFLTFAARVPFYGAVICCNDDPGVRDILPRLKCSCITYGSSPEADYSAREIAFANGRASFDVYHGSSRLGTIVMGVPGMHNVINAVGALAVSMEMGVPFSAAATALAAFAGVKRRLEVVGRGRKVTVFDDYAHHPAEIAATLDSARRFGFKRVTAVFQPHLFSRTRDFMDAFAKSLSAADRIFITEIYRAREVPIPGVTAEGIVKKLQELGHADVHFCPQKADIVKAIAADAVEGEAVVIMGAGDITETARELAEVLLHG